MPTDPAMEWRRLAEDYRQMGDEELRNLAADFVDLTEPAQQALRREMQSRGLGDATAPPSASEVEQSWSVPRKNYDLLVGPLANSRLVPSDPHEGDREQDSARDYTWMALLCECNEVTEAQQLSEVLRRAGIESWIEAMPSYGIGIRNPRVLVAAEELDRAREIAAKPIPQDVIDESKTEVPEYTAPKCPKCGAEDPVLDAVEPSNQWHCEQCDAEWAETVEGAGGSVSSSG
jgi:hypothetical protein